MKLINRVITEVYEGSFQYSTEMKKRDFQITYTKNNEAVSYKVTYIEMGNFMKGFAEHQEEIMSIIDLERLSSDNECITIF